MSLTENQKQRYLRNIILPEIAEEGQEKLLASKILVIGAGGLGSAALFYLAAAGVGNIGIVDDDDVELSNLQRQIIHNNKDLGKKKVLSAAQKLADLDPKITVKTYPIRVNRQNLAPLIKDYDLVLDASDNFPTRFAVNQICHQEKKTLVFAAVKAFAGQLSVFKSYLPSKACYCCFNPNIVDDDFTLPLSEKGILGAVAGAVGAMQAGIAIKEILGIGEDLTGKMLILDFLKNNNRKVSLRKHRNCAVCK